MKFRSFHTWWLFPALLFILVAQVFCNKPQQSADYYLNHDTSVHYVGMDQCRSCHADIYNTFIQTGMGSSFGPATKQKSAAGTGNHPPVYDASSGLYYQARWMGDSLYIIEFLLRGKDTAYKRSERVDFIVGSGQHTNSHLGLRNGYLYQLPLTWYAQKKKWDLPPGFEAGRNVRFSREIGAECMSCHNALPKMDETATNLYSAIPNGIDCERCHGPGELHVKEKLAGNLVDTSLEADRTIVNPKRLSWERQTDLCQRCHLQGNAVLKPGNRFADFRPGQQLADYFNVYLPKYEGAENEFIMASHAQRLQESKCFIQSNKEGKSMVLTCITCHNPHVSVKVTGKQIFNNACIKCHQNQTCKESPELLKAEKNNCVGCHMPKSGSIDIPHVTVHDHKIRVPVSETQKKNIRRFAGLFCITKGNETLADRAEAYINYVEKFEGENQALDSARWYIQQLTDEQQKWELQIRLEFISGNYEKVLKLRGTKTPSSCTDAWTAYRIGQSALNTGAISSAIAWFQQALSLSPNNLNFLNKLALALLMDGKFNESIQFHQKSLSIQSRQEDVWVNLGFAYLQSNQPDKAMNSYTNELGLFPFHQQALLNRSALFNLLGNKPKARQDLELLHKLNPGNLQVKELLSQLSK